MKAVAVFPGKKEIKVIDLEVPQISEPDQVKVRMLDVGVCGTDEELWVVKKEHRAQFC
jgi:glucose 1-dehydrogenase